MGQALIAVIEDDSDVRQALRFSLEASGYAVCSFQDGNQALDSAELAQADCMVVDFNLPGLHGAHVIRALRAAGVSCPAFIITGDASGRAKRAAAEIGVPVLEKPLVAAVLAERITAVLAGSR